MKCENCGAEVTEGRFCNYCGSELPKEGTINIKGNNNTVNTINHYHPIPEERKEYVAPKLKRFVPGNSSFLKKELILYITIETLLFILFIEMCIIKEPLAFFLLLLTICLGIYFFRTHTSHKEEFYEREYLRECEVRRINYKREYDAWFDTLTESEKQTELMRRMLEKQEQN